MLQYIGARYVPIFYQNSLDPTSSEWESNVTYEPLTWVEMSNGYMYISKKTVPANIGSPASNPEYWLEAGQYNAYIQNLQDQIDDMKDGTLAGSLQNQINEMKDGSVSGSLQDQINDMQDGTIPGSVQNQLNRLDNGSYFTDEDHFILLIGDSYITGVAGNNYALPSDQIARTLRKTQGYNLIVSAKGGLCFMGAATNATYYQIENVTLPALSDDQKSKIKTIIIAQGSNDEAAAVSYDATFRSNFDAQVDLCYNALHTACPNAVIYVTNTATGWAYPAKQKRITEELYRYLAGNKMTYLGHTGNALKVERNMPFVLPDGIHPTTAGARTLGNAIVNALLGADYRAIWNYPAGSSTKLTLKLYNDIFTLKNSSRMLLLASDVNTLFTENLPCNGENVMCVMYNPDLSITGQDTLIAAAETSCIIRYNSNNYVEMSCILEFYQNGYVRFMPLEIQNNAYTSYTGIVSLSVSPFELSFSATEV